ncbi:MAG TPA: type II secretion system protein GspG [Methylomirabilota bacterium]|nr:type II secretion system protein GspG [Methylomirabilota bacterium]
MRTLGRMAIVAGLLLALSGCEREEKAVREDLPLARTTKARTDAQTIATAVNTYRVTCGALPESLEALVTQTTVGGAPCGPVLGSIPTPPTGWSPYVYARQGDSFTVTSSGNGQSVSAP